VVYIAVSVEGLPFGNPGLQVLYPALEHGELLVELAQLAAARHVEAVQEVRDPLHVTRDHLNVLPVLPVPGDLGGDGLVGGGGHWRSARHRPQQKARQEPLDEEDRCRYSSLPKLFENIF